MRILFVSPEVAPYSRTGGLGEVSGALPRALAAAGHTVWVVSPLYRGLAPPVHEHPTPLQLRFPFGSEQVRIWTGETEPRHHLVFLDHPGYFGRDGIYGDRGGEYPDNPRRFALLSVGALAAAQALAVEPDIVHLNDWQTGLGAAALGGAFAHTELSRAASVFTIHNLAYQGVYPKTLMTELGLPWELFRPDALEFYDQVSLMKAGIALADVVSTVSPTYAQEIQTPSFGEGLADFLHGYRHKLSGILNGVDYGEWSPEVDTHIAHRYSREDLSGKAECKHALRELFQLRPPSQKRDPPIFGMVSRLASQKGMDLVLEALPALLAEGLQLVVVGNGDAELEEKLRSVALHHPGQVGVFIGFQPRLAHAVEAGSDFFLMPSRYEPCGLNQMYSLRYGTVPIVRTTGGLEDTVVDLELPEGNGFKFRDFEAASLVTAVKRALLLYADPPGLRAAQERGMSREFSWARSAGSYGELYQRARAASRLKSK